MCRSFLFMGILSGRHCPSAFFFAEIAKIFASNCSINHAQCCQTDIAKRFEKKEKRHSDERRCPKANKLSFCQVKEHLRFYPRQVTRDRDICCQTNTSSLLVCIEYALCKCSCLKQGKAEQYGVAHDSPDIRNNIICKCKGLYQYRINTNTDDD